MVPNLTALCGIIPPFIDERSLGGFLFKKGQEQVEQKIDAVKDKFSLSEFLGVKDKIRELAEEMHQRALLSPDPNDDNINFLQYLYDHGSRAIGFRYAPDWMKDLIIYTTTVIGEITHNSVQSLIKWIYEIASTVVLWTPEWFFDNDWFPVTVLKISIISIGTTILLTMVEGLKQIIRMKHTPYLDILKKLPIALGISALTPYIFLYGVRYLNKITEIIMRIGADEIGSNHSLLNNVFFDMGNTALMIIFAILFLATCIPMTYFHAKRWFNLILTGCCTPLAMSAMLFHSTEKYYDIWLKSLKESGTKQIVFAALVSFLGLIMFASPNPTSFKGALSKLILMLGGLHVLAYPPSFVTNAAGYVSERTARDMYGDLKRKYDELARITSKENRDKAGNVLVGSAGLVGKFYRMFKK